jgi:hypothetical protein
VAKARKQKPPKGCIPKAPKRGIRQLGRFSQGFAYVSGTGSVVNKVETFKLAKELVPLGESTKTFPGYPTLFHALAVAGTTAKIGVVLQASRDPTINPRDNPDWFGRFHVFETDSDPKELPPGFIVEATELPRGILSAHVTNLVKRRDTRSWQDRVAAVIDAKTDVDRYRLTRQLIEDFVLLSTTVSLHADAEYENRALGLLGRMALLQGNAVNIDYSVDRAKEGPLGYADIANVDDETETSAKFCAKDSEDLPRTFLAVTRFGFEGRSGPFFLAAALAHEAMHILHWHRAIFLLERWRKLKRPSEFHLWADKTIGGWDAQLVFNLCKRMAGPSLTHLEPHVEGWILSVTYLPLADLKFDEKYARYPAISDFITIQEEPYFLSSGYGVDCVKAYLADRLVKTYKNLPAERQTIVRESLDTKVRQVHGSKARKKDLSFYRWLYEIWGLKFPDLPN